MATWERLDKFEAPLCATETCNQMGVAADVRFERGGVGSYYCADCARRIERMRVKADDGARLGTRRGGSRARRSPPAETARATCLPCRRRRRQRAGRRAPSRAVLC